MKRIIIAFATAGLFATGLTIDSRDASAQVSSTVGSVRGVIKDKATGEPAGGATVMAKSPALQGDQVVLTDANGEYFLSSLPPGLYVLTIIYADATFSRGNVLVQVGKEVVVNVTVDTNVASARPKGETIEIQGTVPVIDEGSTKIGVTLTDTYTKNIPTGRTFGGVLGAVAGSQDDFFGTSIAGATSVENTYIVEGINTTDTGVGTLSTNLPNEFVSETEVITGGYNAEYGRATGGIINVVTKQGSNEFHGSVFGYLSPGSFVSAAHLIQSEGGSIDTKQDLDKRYDLGFEVGGPIKKDKVWFHVGFMPAVTNETLTRLVQSQVDANGDGVPDLGGDGFTRHEEVSRDKIPTTVKTYYFTAKLNGAINQNHQWQLTALGNPSVSDDSFSTALIHSPQTELLHRAEGAYDFAGKWTSKFGDGKTELDAVLGYHHGYGRQSPLSPEGGEALVFYNYERSLYDFADLEGAIDKCQDGGPGDLYPKIRNCPVTNYAESGLGLLENRTNDRTSGTVSLTQRVKAGSAGTHIFKGGLDFEVATYNSFQYNTGGAYYTRACNTDPATGACSDDPGAVSGEWQINSYSKIVRNLTPAEVADPAMVMLAPGQEICSAGRALCERSDSLVANTTNRNIGLYLQDSWQIVPNFTINAGIRYEQQVGYTASQLQGTVSPTGEIVPQVGYTLNNWAPRAGFIYDPTKDGKSKIFGHWGRFYENVPMDLNVRSFGGEIDRIGTANANAGTGMADPNCNVDHMPGVNPADALKKCTDQATTSLLGGGSEYVSPGLKGQYSEELIAGAEMELLPDLKIGIEYVHRTLPMVIEDILLPIGSGVYNGYGGDYLITNPGQDQTDTANELHQKALALAASSDPTQQALASLFEYRSQAIRKAGDAFDKPSRNYDAVELHATQRPTSRSLLMASYTYSKERGNFPGLFSTETNQLDPNISSQYDLPSLLANRYGLLGLDRTHNFKVDGFYQFDLKKAGSLTTGMSFRAESGIPHNALGTDPVYGQGEAYLLPRGSFQRSPVTTELDVHLAYGRKVNKTTSVEAFVNIFNLINQQDELVTDEYYTFDGALPIVGGDPEDLKHLKAIDLNGVEGGTTVHKNPNFTKPLNRQAPRSVQLGFRLTF